MKKGIALVLAVAALSGAAGCSYSGVGVAGDKVIVTRNDNLLFGLMRKVYVCKVTDAGLTSCQNADSP